MPTQPQQTNQTNNANESSLEDDWRILRPDLPPRRQEQRTKARRVRTTDPAITYLKRLRQGLIVRHSQAWSAAGNRQTPQPGPLVLPAQAGDLVRFQSPAFVLGTALADGLLGSSPNAVLAVLAGLGFHRSTNFNAQLYRRPTFLELTFSDGLTGIGVVIPLLSRTVTLVDHEIVVFNFGQQYPTRTHQSVYLRL